MVDQRLVNNSLLQIHDGLLLGILLLLRHLYQLQQTLRFGCRLLVLLLCVLQLLDASELKERLYTIISRKRFKL